MTVNSPGTDGTDKARGSLAAVFAIFAFLACNGLVILVALLSLIGISVSINPHVQAAAISLFAILSLALVWRGHRQNQKIGPLILAATATFTLIGTMYIHFDKIVESFALLMLFAAAFWSWQLSRARDQGE